MLAVKATDDALQVFNDMKLGKKTAYVTYLVEGADIKEEKVVMKADVDESYLAAFITAIKESGEPRFGVVDWNHKLLFVSWTPETAKARHKMTYSAAKESFIQALVGIQLKLQATDDKELSEEVITEKTKSNV
jgi:cofilin